MLGVDMAVQEFVLVHIPMDEILPRVHYEHRHQDLDQLDMHRRLD